MDRTYARKKRQFEDIIADKQELDRFKKEAFLEVIYSARNLAMIAQQLISSKVGLNRLTEAMRFDLSTNFMNGSAAKVLLSFQEGHLADVGSGIFMQPILLAIVTPSIFWDALVDSFKKRLLNNDAQQAFAYLFLNLIRLPKNHCEQFRQTAREQSIITHLLDSRDNKVQTLGAKIKDVIATFDIGTNLSIDDYRPGGRHDNDFANFRDIAILPTAGELLSKEAAFLRGTAMLTDPETVSNRVAFHLDNQFRLLREDMVHEMREELALELKDIDASAPAQQTKKKRRALHLNGLKLVDLHLQVPNRIPGADDKYCNWGLVFEVEGELIKGNAKERKRFLVDTPTFLRHQSLGCFIVDGDVVSFPSINRDESLMVREPLRIVLQFQGETSIKKTLKRVYSAKDIKFIQVDTPIFAYEPILRALQEKNELPLSDELLFWTQNSTEIESSVVPRSLTEKLDAMSNRYPHQDLQTVLELSTSCKLDTAQMKSLITGLKKRVALIQGPPGKFTSVLLSGSRH